jgi:hypothetical protein
VLLLQDPWRGGSPDIESDVTPLIQGGPSRADLGRDAIC